VVLDNTLKTAGGSWLITITRDGSGTVVAEDMYVTLLIDSVKNMQHKGPSGEFIMMKTTLADGVTAIDETSGEADAIGLNAMSITITPSGFTGVAPTITPASLVAGDTGNIDFVFTTQNPIPTDAKIYLEVPSTFTNVQSANVISSNNIDGVFTVTVVANAPAVFDTTMKTSGGSWVIEIERDGSGAVVAENIQVTIEIDGITNQQFEGASGEFIMMKTTLNDGTTSIDETSTESDAIGLVAPSITFTPSGYSNNVPTVTPQSLVAGDLTDVELVFVTQNPIPVDGVIYLEIPDTFTNVASANVVSNNNIDGGFTVTTAANVAAVFDNTMKTSGGSWVIEIERDGTGTIVAEDITVTLMIDGVTNSQFEVATGAFPFIKTTLADKTTAIDEISTEADAIGQAAPSVTITPSGFKQQAPDVHPLSLVAGDTGYLNFTFVTQNPIPGE